MSNKRLTAVQLSSGYVLHDASDPACERHESAKRHKGIQPQPERTCPTCNGTATIGGEDTNARPARKRRKASRP